MNFSEVKILNCTAAFQKLQRQSFCPDNIYFALAIVYGVQYGINVSFHGIVDRLLSSSPGNA